MGSISYEQYHRLNFNVLKFFFSALHVLTALKEEEYLLKRFGEHYEEYMRRFIPYVF